MPQTKNFCKKPQYLCITNYKKYKFHNTSQKNSHSCVPLTQAQEIPYWLVSFTQTQDIHCLVPDHFTRAKKYIAVGWKTFLKHKKYIAVGWIPLIKHKKYIAVGRTLLLLLLTGRTPLFRHK
jgi:hypothetical protein